jgi:flavodoxin
VPRPETGIVRRGLRPYDKHMACIPVMFFSGSGSTALIAELIAGRLAARGHDAPLLSVEQNSDPGLLGACDLAVIGTPTYHNCPAGTLLDWIARWPPGAGPARAFLFATFGLYTGNAPHLLGQALAARGVRTVGHTGFRGPASDSVLMLPAWIGFMFRYERRIARRIDTAAGQIAALAEQPDAPGRLPPRRWYAPLDHVPNRVIARNRFRRRLAPGLRVLPGRWQGEAVDCPRGCWQAGPGGVPVCDPADCDFCLRCVHRSPRRAVIWDAAMQDGPRLDPAFYAARRAEIAAQFPPVDAG